MLDWLIEQCLTSQPTHYRLSGRRAEMVELDTKVNTDYIVSSCFHDIRSFYYFHASRKSKAWNGRIDGQAAMLYATP